MITVSECFCNWTIIGLYGEFEWWFLFLDVNGKVIHLVQRPPPGSARVSGSSSSSSSNNTNSTSERHRNNDSGRNNVPFIHVLDGTVLGAMAIPMNTNSGVSWRLSFCRRHFSYGFSSNFDWIFFLISFQFTSRRHNQLLIRWIHRQHCAWIESL